MRELRTDDIDAWAAAATRRTLRTILITAILVLAGATALVLTSSGDAHGASPRTTHKVFVRPVTADGHAAKGYRVVADHRAPIECTQRSRVAVDQGIADCGSSADYTPACWASHTKAHVLCLSDPFTHTLRSIRLSGAFPATRKPRHATPQALTTHDGRHYLVRVGGAWSQVKQHPSWVGFYFERKSFTHDIYGPVSGDGINRAHAWWTVTAYRHDAGRGVRHHVDKAYYVGTAG